MNDTLARKPSLLLIICLVTLPQISETIYSPALPDIAHSLSTTMSLTEWTLSIYFFGFALGVGVWGRVSDHIGRRHTALIGLVIYVVTSCYVLYYLRLN
ncbi:MAG: multidrug effflux MFS transporter [Gammaproteobacteria bacterium]|nr:multidrug effflux MFS transporter [Gammaproteobacteria bacterium]